jgi:hypothetical protein
LNIGIDWKYSPLFERSKPTANDFSASSEGVVSWYSGMSDCRMELRLSPSFSRMPLAADESDFRTSSFLSASRIVGGRSFLALAAMAQA